jgi:hypothetical protein
VTATVRLQDRLRAIPLSGLQLSSKEQREVRERLAQIAQYVIDQEAGRVVRAKRTPTRGRPTNKAMHEIFGGLTGVWLDYGQSIAGVSYFGAAERYGGRFVRFTQNFCKALADALEKDPAARGLVRSLRSVQNHPVRVRSWLRAIGLPQFVSRVRRSR